MADEKVEVSQTPVKVNAYRVIQECIERGLSYGYGRAFKHVDLTDEERAFLDKHKDRILEAQEDAAMQELCEYLSFGDE